MKSFSKFITESKINIDIERNAREIFGSDDAPAKRGYIYSNGEFLNLLDGTDHREINMAFAPDPDEFPTLKYIDLPEEHMTNSASRNMIAFMDYCGAVRWSVSNGYLTMSYIHKLNPAQKRSITHLIQMYNISEASVEVYDNKYMTIKSAEGGIWDRKIQKLL